MLLAQAYEASLREGDRRAPSSPIRRLLTGAGAHPPQHPPSGQQYHPAYPQRAPPPLGAPRVASSAGIARTLPPAGGNRPTRIANMLAKLGPPFPDYRRMATAEHEGGTPLQFGPLPPPL
eukprot:6838409-Pyramimonas_sp.AAC.2